MQSNGVAASLALAGAVATMVANFGTALIVARAGAAEAGVFFAATALVTILGNTTGLGTMTGLVYHLPAVLHTSPRHLIAVALGPVVAASGLATVALLAAAGPAASVIASERVDDVATMLAWLAPTIPAWALNLGLLGATRGLGSMTPTVAINQVFKPLAQLAAITVAVTLIGPSPAVLAVAWGAPVILTAIGSLGAVVAMGGFAGASSASGPTVTSREFWRYTRPRAVATGFQIALERVDVILVSALAGPAAAGIYGTITRYVTAGNFLVFSIGQSTAPAIRRAAAASRNGETARLLRLTTTWMVAVAWPYALVLATRPADMVALLNPDFGGGALPLAVLGLALLINAAAGPIDLALLMLGRSGSSLAVTAAALATDVVLVLVLVPPLGIVGAAIAWAAAIGVQNGAASILVRRTTGLWGPSGPAAIAATGAVVAIVPLGLLVPGGLGGLVVTVAAGGLIHGLWLLRSADRLGLAALLRRLPGVGPSAGRSAGSP